MKAMGKNPERQSLLWLLLKNRLMAQLGINVFRHETDRGRRNKWIAERVIITILLLMLAAYCGGMAFGLAYLGLAGLIPGMTVVLSSLFSLVFTMFKANGELFGFKDYELVMSLPVPVKTVVHSRFLNMYLWNTLITFLVMLPMGMVYAVYTRPALPVYFLWLAGSLLVCLFPTTLAAVLGAVIAAIASRFRYASAASTLLSMALVIALLVVSMMAGSANSGLSHLIDFQTGNPDLAAISALAPVIAEELNRVYPLAKLFTSGVIQGRIGSLLLFAGISIGCYALFVSQLASRYRQINTALTARAKRGGYQLQTISQGSPLAALYKKTILRILKSTVCATNLLIGCVIALMVASVVFLAGPERVMEQLDLSDYLPMVKNAVGYVIAAMVCTTNTASVSLALEGKNIWLIQSLPIPPKTLYDSYLLTNLTFTIPTSLLCSVVLSLSLKTEVIGTALLFLTPLTFTLFTAVAGIFIGNRMAFYDWQDETQLVKQSFMSMIGMLGGMALVIICGVIALSGILAVAPQLLTLIFDLVLLALAAVIYTKESRRPVKA